MIDIKAIVNVIDSLFESQEVNPLLTQHFKTIKTDFIRSFLKSKDESFPAYPGDARYLVDILAYIESLPIKTKTLNLAGFFSGSLYQDSNTTMRSILTENKIADGVAPLTTIEEGIQLRKEFNITAALPESDKDILIQIYTAVVTELKLNSENKAAQINWIYSAPTDDYGVVNNASIENWRAQHINQTAEATSSVYTDFARNIEINGHTTANKSVEEIQESIKQFVSTSNHSEQDKQKLVEWLNKFGGQAMNTFLISMIRDQVAFSLNPELGSNDLPLSYKATSTYGLWTLNQAGEITFSQDFLISRLEYNGGETAIVKQPHGFAQAISQEEWTALLESKKPLDHLIEIQATTKLTLIEREASYTSNTVVVPEVVSLKIASHTELLISPERKLNVTNDIASAAAPARPTH